MPRETLDVHLPRDVMINRFAVPYCCTGSLPETFWLLRQKMLGLIGLFVNQGYPLPGFSGLGVIHPTTTKPNLRRTKG